MKFVYVFMVLATVSLTCNASGILEDSTELFITVKKIAKCADMGKDSIPYSFKMRKINETSSTMSINATVPFDINNDVTVNIVMMNKALNGKWSRMIEKSFKVCELKNMISSDKIMMTQLQEMLKCPLPKGRYEIKDAPNTFKINAPPLFPLGEYKSETALYTHKGNKPVRESCHSVTFVTTKSIK